MRQPLTILPPADSGEPETPADETKAIVNLGDDSFSVDENGVHINYTDSSLTDFYWDGTTNLTIADEAVITITKPYTQKANLTISANAKIVAENGTKVTVTDSESAFIIKNGAQVEMSYVNIERNVGVNSHNLILVDGATLTCVNVSILEDDRGVFEITNNGQLVMEGDETVILSNASSEHGRPIFDNVYGTVTIKGGKYTRTGNSGQIVGNGATATVNIQGGTFKNPDDHWYECSHAECVVNNGKVPHTYTEFHSDADDHWYECSDEECTKISDETSHDFVRMTDDNYHWYQCSDPACEFVKDKEAHTASYWITDIYQQVGINGKMHTECTICKHILATKFIPALPFAREDDHDDVVVKPDFTNCPKDATCPVWSFKDAVAFEWYHDGVHYCIENGLMNGLPENLFDPAGATTRAQIVTILWRLEGQPLVAVAEGFNDVSDSDWYNNAVRWASANGIAEGYGDGIFAPNDVVTREQMVTILWRYAMYKGFDVSVGVETNILSYGDAFDIAHYAIPAMQWACGAGLVTGIADENGGMILDPQGATTRAQMATLLMRFCVEIEK